MKISLSTLSGMHLLGFAKKKLKELRDAREKGNVPLLTKYIPVGHFLVFLKTASWGDEIRISGEHASAFEFLCHPRFSVGGLVEITSRIDDFYTIDFHSFGYPGYDTKRTKLETSDVVYPLNDGDNGTSVLKSDGRLTPTADQNYGNLDWKGNDTVLSWKGAHSRYGVPYQATVAQLYTPLTSACCYEKGKAHRTLPVMFLLPEGYAGEVITNIAELEPLIIDDGFTYGPVQLLCRGAAYFVSGANTWLINVGAATSYNKNYILALQVGKAKDAEWLVVDERGEPTWVLSGLHDYLVNTSWFFSASGTKAVATDNYKMHHLTMTINEEGFPLAHIEIEDTYSNSRDDGIYQTEASGDPNAYSGSYVAATRVEYVSENTSGVFAADYVGENLVVAIVEQSFDAKEQNSYTLTWTSDQTDPYVGATTKTTRLNQTSPHVVVDCKTKLKTDFGTFTLQSVDSYYGLEHNRDTHYERVEPPPGHPNLYLNTYYAEQITKSKFKSTIATVPFLDLRHGIVVTIEKTFEQPTNISGYITVGQWYTYITPYMPPGSTSTTPVNISNPVEISKNTVHVSGMGVELIGEMGTALGMINVSNLFTEQTRLINPRLPSASDVYTGVINAYFSEHPIGSFCVAKDFENYFYSFLIGDKVFSGSSLVETKKLFKQTYDKQTKNSDPDLLTVTHRGYFPIGVY